MQTESIPLSYYQPVTKAVILIGLPLFMFLGGGALWSSIGASTAIATFILIAVGIMFTGLGVHALRLLPHLQHKIGASPDGLHIFDSKLRETFHPWSQISRVKDHAIIEVFNVYDNAGKCVLSIDYHILHFEQLREDILSYLSEEK